MLDIIEPLEYIDETIIGQKVIASHADAIVSGVGRIDNYYYLSKLSIENLEQWNRFKNRKLKTIASKFENKFFSIDKIFILCCDLALFGDSFWIVDRDMILNKRPWTMFRIATAAGNLIEYQCSFDGHVKWQPIAADPKRLAWHGIHRYPPELIVHARINHDSMRSYGKSLVVKDGKWLTEYMQMLTNGPFISCVADTIDEIIEKRDKNV